MTSVVERAATLTTRMQGLKDATREDFKIESIIPACNTLEGVRDGFRKQRLRAAAVGLNGVSSKAQTALRELDKVRAQFSKDPGLIIRGTVFNNFVEALGAVVKDTRSEVDKMLEGHRTAWAFVSVGYLQLFLSVPSVAELCREGLDLHKELVTENWRPPEDPVAIRTILQKGERLLDIKRQLDEFECPDSVRDFLNRAQSQSGAPLGMLADTTRVWLERNGLLQKLRIRLG